MKRRLTFLMAVLLVFSHSPLGAQSVPKAEVFAGFSAVHINADQGNFRITPVGWQTSIAGNINKTFGLVGDFGGVYKTFSGTKLISHHFLGGVQLNKRTEKATVFAHAMWGGVNFRLDGSETDFEMGYGGGIDVHATNRIAVRLIQFDWLPTRADSQWIKNVTRYGFGIVFKSRSE